MLGKGAIAADSHDELGLILSDKPEFVYYGLGNFDEAWTGIHVSTEKFGEPWSSRNPRLVATRRFWDKLERDEPDFL